MKMFEGAGAGGGSGVSVQPQQPPRNPQLGAQQAATPIPMTQREEQRHDKHQPPGAAVQGENLTSASQQLQETVTPKKNKKNKAVTFSQEILDKEDEWRLSDSSSEDMADFIRDAVQQQQQYVTDEDEEAGVSIAYLRQEGDSLRRGSAKVSTEAGNDEEEEDGSEVWSNAPEVSRGTAGQVARAAKAWPPERVSPQEEGLHHGYGGSGARCEGASKGYDLTTSTGVPLTDMETGYLRTYRSVEVRT